MLSLKEYLQNCSKKLQENSQIVFVLGNESADLDSIVSSLIFSYLSYLQDTKKYFIPLVQNIQKVIQLKHDVQEVISFCNLDLSDLFYFDQIDKNIIKNSKFILLDFNQLDDNLEINSNQVIGIIDHHIKTHNYQDLSFELIKPQGSNVTLIMKFLGKNILNLLDCNQLKMIQAVINLDSDLFNPQFENKVYFQEDLDLNQFLENQTNLQSTDFKYIQQLRINSFQLNKNNYINLLYLDFKKYNFKFGQYGISVIQNNLSNYLSFDDVEIKLNQFLNDTNLKFLIIIFIDQQIKGQKDYLNYCPNLKLSDRIQNIFQELQAQGFTETSIQEKYYFQNNNPQITRKKFQPIFQSKIDEQKFIDSTQDIILTGNNYNQQFLYFFTIMEFQSKSELSICSQNDQSLSSNKLQNQSIFVFIQKIQNQYFRLNLIHDKMLSEEMEFYKLQKVFNQKQKKTNFCQETQNYQIETLKINLQLNFQLLEQLQSQLSKKEYDIDLLEFEQIQQKEELVSNFQSSKDQLESLEIINNCLAQEIYDQLSLLLLISKQKTLDISLNENGHLFKIVKKSQNQEKMDNKSEHETFLLIENIILRNLVQFKGENLNDFVMKKLKSQQTSIKIYVTSQEQFDHLYQQIENFNWKGQIQFNNKASNLFIKENISIQLVSKEDSLVEYVIKLDQSIVTY